MNLSINPFQPFHIPACVRNTANMFLSNIHGGIHKHDQNASPKHWQRLPASQSKRHYMRSARTRNVHRENCHSEFRGQHEANVLEFPMDDAYRRQHLGRCQFETNVTPNNAIYSGWHLAMFTGGRGHAGSTEGVVMSRPM